MQLLFRSYSRIPYPVLMYVDLNTVCVKIDQMASYLYTYAESLDDINPSYAIEFIVVDKTDLPEERKDLWMCLNNRDGFEESRYLLVLEMQPESEMQMQAELESEESLQPECEECPNSSSNSNKSSNRSSNTTNRRPASGNASGDASGHGRDATDMSGTGADSGGSKRGRESDSDEATSSSKRRRQRTYLEEYESRKHRVVLHLLRPGKTASPMGAASQMLWYLIERIGQMGHAMGEVARLERFLYRFVCEFLPAELMEEALIIRRCYHDRVMMALLLYETQPDDVSAADHDLRLAWDQRTRELLEVSERREVEQKKIRPPSPPPVAAVVAPSVRPSPQDMRAVVQNYGGLTWI